MSSINLLILLAAGAALAWKFGLLDDLIKPPGGGGGGPSLTEDQAALIVSRNRADICPAMKQMSGGFWNCDNEGNTIATIKQWFYKVDPDMVSEFVTLVGYVKKMGWT